MTESKPSAEFVTLWTAHVRRVYAYIYTLVPDWTDAEDILQETSVFLLKRFDDFKPGTSFPAWACKVAHLKSLEFLSRRKTVTAGDEEFLEMVANLASHAADAWERRLDALTDCLTRLPAKDRTLIELRYRGSHSIPQVAEQVNRTSSAVYKALSRIHERLLTCIRRKLAEGDAP